MKISMRKTEIKVVATAMAVAFLVAGVGIIPQAQAAAKPTVAKRVSVKVGKCAKLKIKSGGLQIKKVKASVKADYIASIAKTSKSAVTITGVNKGTTTVKLTVRASAGGKTNTYKLSAKVNVKDNPDFPTYDEIQKALSELASAEKIKGQNTTAVAPYGDLLICVTSDLSLPQTIEVKGYTLPIKWIAQRGVDKYLNLISGKFLKKPAYDIDTHLQAYWDHRDEKGNEASVYSITDEYYRLLIEGNNADTHPVKPLVSVGEGAEPVREYVTLKLSGGKLIDEAGKEWKPTVNIRANLDTSSGKPLKPETVDLMLYFTDKFYEEDDGENDEIFGLDPIPMSGDDFSVNIDLNQPVPYYKSYSFVKHIKEHGAGEYTFMCTGNSHVDPWQSNTDTKLFIYHITVKG